MAERKPMFMSAEGYSEEMAVGDSMTLGGLTMGGNIAMGTNKVTGLGDPSSAQDAATKSYVDTMVISGGVVKEPLYSQDQLSNSLGIKALEALFFANQPAVGDTVVLKNGTLTRTYSCVADQASESAATDVSIETDAATAMQRLVTRANADAGNTQWDLFFDTDHDDVNPSGTVEVIERAVAGGNSATRVYGVWATQANFKVLEFATGTTTLTILPYYTKTSATASTTDPGYGRSGLRRQVASLVDGEIHLTLDTDNQWAWDASTPTWQLMSGPGSIPDATSASGGGIKGKVTFDSDYGLVVNSGVAKIAVATAGALQFTGTTPKYLGVKLEATTPTLQVDGSNQLGAKLDAAGAIITGAGGLKVKLESSNPTLQIDGSDQLGVKLDTAGAIITGAGGVKVKLEASNPTLQIDGSDQLGVKLDGAGAIITGASGIKVKLPTTNPALAINGSDELDVKYQTAKGLGSDGSGLFVKIDNSTVTYDGSGNLQASGSPRAQRVENSLTTIASGGGVNAGDPVYYTATADRIDKADTSPDAKALVVGVARTSAAAGNAAPVVSAGPCAGVLSSAGPGTPYYLATGGGLSTSLPSGGKRVIQIGVAMNPTDLFVRVVDYGKKAA